MLTLSYKPTQSLSAKLHFLEDEKKLLLMNYVHESLNRMFKNDDVIQSKFLVRLNNIK